MLTVECQNKLARPTHRTRRSADNAHARSVEARGGEAASGEGLRTDVRRHAVSHGDPYATTGPGKKRTIYIFFTFVVLFSVFLFFSQRSAGEAGCTACFE